MNSSDKTTVGKLHIVITIVILLEVILLLGIFSAYLLVRNKVEETNIDSEIPTEKVTSDEQAPKIIEEAPSTSEKTEAAADLPLSTFEYTIDGITFEIPEKYRSVNNSYQSDFSQLYFISQKIEGFWAIYMIASDKDIDGYADSAVSSYISNAKRDSAADSSVAGCKSRTYKYSGNINNEKYLLAAEIVVSPSNDGVIGIIFVTPEKDSELEDYAEIIGSGKVK